MNTDIKHIFDVFADLEGCCLHEAQWKPIEVDRQLAWVSPGMAEPLDSDSSSLLLVQLKNGDYGLLAESSDYTGHGCQCGSYTVREPTLRELLAHCEEEELLMLVTSP